MLPNVGWVLAVANGMAIAVALLPFAWLSWYVAWSRLAWWSFLMATAHGAGLMPVPFMLSLCAAAALVAAAHTLATLVAGIAMAWAV
ncbi:MAG: hypothetical protein WCC39_06975, partial [Telluria sp.]